MRVELSPVALADKAALRAVLDPYLVEHADQVDPARVHGDPTDDPYFDLYWVEADRAPFWILADGQRAGFTLLNAYSPSGEGTERAVSEFCVLPDFRRHRIGAAAAAAVFATHAGQWELMVHRANALGFPFWPRVIAAAGVQDWRRIEQEDRVIHRFRT